MTVERDLRELRTEVGKNGKALGQLRFDLEGQGRRLDERIEQSERDFEQNVRDEEFVNQDVLEEVRKTNRTLDFVLQRFDEEIDQFNAEKADIDDSLDTIEGNTVTIQQNIDTINADVANVEQNIETINATQANLSQSVETINADITTVNTSISTIESEQTSLSQSITSLQSDVATLEQNVGDLTGSEVTLSQRVDSVEAETVNLITRVDSVENVTGNVNIQNIVNGDVDSLLVQASSIATVMLQTDSIDVLNINGTVFDPQKGNAALKASVDAINDAIGTGDVSGATIIDQVNANATAISENASDLSVLENQTETTITFVTDLINAGVDANTILNLVSIVINGQNANNLLALRLSNLENWRTGCVTPFLQQNGVFC